MKINKIVIHCSDTPNGRPDTAEDIHRWHQEKGWDGIGYHYVIEVDGQVRNGRPHYWQGSHVAGHNRNSLGICLVGRDQFNDAQWVSLQSLVRALDSQYEGATVLGHRDLDSEKTCPNFDVKAWWCSEIEAGWG